MSEKLTVSQSLLNKYLEYKEGNECGEFIKLAMIDRLVDMKKTDPMRMGERFEYEAVGNMDYNGNIPEAFMLKNGAPSAKQYTIASQVLNFKTWFNTNGYEVLAHGERIDIDFPNFVLSGMIDLVFKDTEGMIYLCDLKLTGNIGNTESPWGWYPEAITEHLNKRNQMMIYLLLGQLSEKYKTNKFVFYVASSKDQNEFVPYEVTVSDETLEKEKERIFALAEEISFEYEIGLTPRPSGSRCAKCTAKDICTKKDENKSGNLQITF